jgi:two-component system cell cycle sensor histidine kinase/response regulator CckA
VVASWRDLPEAALALVDAVPDYVLICDQDARIVHLHPLTEKLLGLATSAAAGRPLEPFVISLDERPFTVAALRALAEGGPDSSATIVLRHAWGVQLHKRLAARAARVDGQDLWFLSLRNHPAAHLPPLDHDVYRTVFERSPVGLCHLDARGVITAVNDAFAASIGSPRRLLIGMDVLTLPMQEMVADVRRALDGELVRSQRSYRSATGNKDVDIQLVLAPILDDAQRITGAVAISADVSAQVQAARALERSHAALHAVMESAPDAIAVLRAGKYVLVNSRTVEMLGAKSAQDLLGRPVTDFLDAGEHAILARRMAEVTPHEALPPFEYRMRRTDGSHVCVEAKSIAFEHEGQASVLVFGRDVTERRELEARLQQADRMASVGTLAAGVAHEINNPLAYVMMTASVMADRARKGLFEPDAALDELESILEGAERIRTIVRDLSAFSRRADDVSTSVDLNPVIEGAATMVRHTLRYRARLVLELAPQLPAVRGDPARLAQVFVNLLVNAAQAIPEGHPEEHAIVVRSEATDRVVRVRVRDDGQGMAAHVAQRIFEPFFTTKAPGVGTGLGLSICHGIVRSHGGTISAASQPGRGSEFVVELPVESAGGAAVEHAPPVPAPQPAAAAEAPPARILIIDDEAAFASVLFRTLAARHEVVVAHGGRQGLALLDDQPAPDMILCDVMMPDLTGMDVLEWLSAQHPGLAERFVFMTGGAVTERARHALAATTRPVLAKPFERADVERVLRTLRPLRS